MNLRLKSPNGPIYGFIFKDPRTGREFNTLEIGTDKDVVVQIIVHRSANPRIYPTNERQHTDRFYVLQELYAQKAVKYPDLFEDSNMAPPPPPEPPKPQQVNTICPQCGSRDAFPVYCATCGNGQKLIKYRCAKCGAERNP